MKKLTLLFFVFVFFFNLKSQTILDIIVASPNHTILESAVDSAGLNATLSGSGTFTVFAPTDDAFNALPSGVLDDLFQDPMGELADILLYHVLANEVGSSDLMNGLIADAVNTSNTLKFTVTSTNDAYVNQALISVTDVPATNGVVHVIDAVVLPLETVVDVAIDNGFTTLTTAVVEAELLPALTNPAGTYTVFAPTDDAFALIPAATLNDLLADPTGDLQDILLYHTLGSEVMAADVTNGLIADALSPTNTLKFTVNSMGGVFVNQAPISATDIGADNGVVHVIDQVVLPVETVVDVAIDNGFTTLTTAVVEAELLNALTDPAGTFTVFAPTDDAFALIPAGTLNDLLADPTGDLQDILLYHTLGSEVMAADVTNGLIADALSPTNTLKFTVNSMGGVFVNQAPFSATDIGADNGVVHVIDQVVLPVETVVDVAIDNGFTTLTTAVVEAELLNALTDPAGTFTVFAPTDDAFALIPAATLNDLLADPTGDLQDILLYHTLGSEVMAADVTNGLIADALSPTNTLKFTVNSMGGVFVNQAPISTTDIGADNGVVHVIDQVVLPVETVVDVAIDNGFTTLTTALVEAELLNALTDPAGTFTVFAPTDNAFADLPDGVLATLLEDPTGELQQILLYHVAGSTILSTGLSDGQSIATLQGSTIDVSIDGTMVMVDASNVTGVDVTADNGVVHIIDMVLLPPVGISEFNEIDLNIYPNPFADVLFMDAESTIEIIEVFDMFGKQVMTLNDFNEKRIDMSALSAGIYYLRVTMDGRSGTFKIVKN